MGNERTITCYVTLTGEVWAASRDLKGAYAVRQDIGGLGYLFGHFGHVQPRKRVDTENLIDPADLAGHAFCWLAYDTDDDSIRLTVDAAVVNEFEVAARFLIGFRGPRFEMVVE